MLRGAIEGVAENMIFGWVYSPLTPVKGARLLAFHGTRCCGAGDVDVFRQDLADVGLGDGHSGFRFPFTLHEGENPLLITLRFKESDFWLAQKGVALQES